ncbi:hypothetical protein K461DRAFT_48686 [Myriangium duriaei CBS 260.36]|uniref:Uncharacterized protein n=1 Tax=Myriangium duriaei CBS 260.36 TaxID=1168546 RepID=A0A9P4IT78_9PEZI|nr:hypothetical protein K461DRAFT_48686 [Myriangium duriaei CBS 260.36]
MQHDVQAGLFGALNDERWRVLGPHVPRTAPAPCNLPSPAPTGGAGSTLHGIKSACSGEKKQQFCRSTVFCTICMSCIAILGPASSRYVSNTGSGCMRIGRRPQPASTSPALRAADQKPGSIRTEARQLDVRLSLSLLSNAQRVSSALFIRSATYPSSARAHVSPCDRLHTNRPCCILPGVLHDLLESYCCNPAAHGSIGYVSKRHSGPVSHSSATSVSLFSCWSFYFLPSAIAIVVPIRLAQQLTELGPSQLLSWADLSCTNSR